MAERRLARVHRRKSTVAEELEADVLDRFARYVRIDTQSDRDSDTYPSTAKQLELSRLLESELRELGLDDVELTEHGYVLATLPPVGVGAGVDVCQQADGRAAVRADGGKGREHVAVLRQLDVVESQLPQLRLEEP